MNRGVITIDKAVRALQYDLVDAEGDAASCPNGDTCPCRARAAALALAIRTLELQSIPDAHPRNPAALDPFAVGAFLTALAALIVALSRYP